MMQTVRGLFLFTLIAAAQTPDFVPAAHIATAGALNNVAVGDVNGDGKPDLVTTDAAASGLAVMLGSGQGAFGAPVLRYLGFAAANLVVADFNLDGKSDAAVSNGASLGVLLSTGNGSFSGPIYASTGMNVNFFTAGDFNNDGKPDLAVTGSGGYALLLGNGTGAFSAPRLIAGSQPAFYLIAADFNHDGKLDIAGQNGLSGATFLGDGAGGFAAPVSTINIPYGTVAADFDGDGFPDLAMTTTQQRQNFSTQYLSVTHGFGDGRFTGYYNLVLTGASISQPITGDFNHDGIPDIVMRRGSENTLLFLPGTGHSTLVYPSAYDFGAVPNGLLLSADADGNGSPDVVVGTANQIVVFRSSHGDPALPAALSAAPSNVIGGAPVQATVVLGGPAPAAGLTLTLASSDPSLAWFPSGDTVTIPGGAAQASVSLSTAAVAAATPVTLTATGAGVTQRATLNLVAPYSLTNLRFEPASQYGIFTTQAVVSLSGPADAAATVYLASANPGLAGVPASVTVPPGTASVSVPVVLTQVAVDTPVLITAAMDGVSRTSSVTILRAQDAVQVARAQFVAKSFRLKVEATGTNATATVTVYNAATGRLLGTLDNAGGGKFNGTFSANPVQAILLKSSFGGSVSGAVEQK